MTALRGIVLASAIAAVGACRPQPSTYVSPQRGPRTSISATYSGGYMHRQLRARFQTDRTAYVMVGHVGGDGRVQILFPDNASKLGRVVAKRSYSTPTFYANYDASPAFYSSFYSSVSSTARSVGAQIDSYDGAGHGFIFLIASFQPLNFDAITETGEFDDLVLPGYSYSYDPRVGIRSLADAVADGGEYTLDFADSFGTVGYPTMADALYDCAVMSFFPFSSSQWLWNSISSWMYSNYYGSPACGGRQRAWLGPYYYVVNDYHIAPSVPVLRPYTPKPRTPSFSEVPAYRRRAIDRPSDFTGTHSNRRSSGSNDAGTARSGHSTTTRQPTTRTTTTRTTTTRTTTARPTTTRTTSAPRAAPASRPQGGGAKKQ